MTTYPLDQIVKTAREKSDFYKEFYQNLALGPVPLAQIPVLDSSAFWKAHTLASSSVLTDTPHGVVFKSGGTTGQPRMSHFTNDEWDTFCTAFGKAMARGGAIQPQDRFLNVFYAGDLYASFLFIHHSIELSGTPVLQLPVSGGTAFAGILQQMLDFCPNVMGGVPTTLLKVAEFLQNEGHSFPEMERILFGGESMSGSQRALLAAVFPNATVRSIGCASVDGGLIGWADASCRPDEHHVFQGETLVEILDEDTLEPIQEVGVPGKLVLTSLTRQLMPIIRYPSGDRALWTRLSEGQGHSFELLGRSDEGARVGVVSVYYDHISALFDNLRSHFLTSGFQLLLSHFDRKDKLTLRVAVTGDTSDKKNWEALFHAAFALQRPAFFDAVSSSKIHPLEMEWVHPHQLESNPRTGKIRRVIDTRKAGH